jgi:hypothetical protein
MAGDLLLSFDPSDDANASSKWPRPDQDLCRVKAVSAMLARARAIRGQRPVVLPFRTGKRPQTAISWGFSTLISRFCGEFSSASNALRRICVLNATAPGKMAAGGRL